MRSFLRIWWYLRRYCYFSPNEIALRLTHKDAVPDFFKNKKTLYFQVAATVRNETALRRELAPLEKINDHYQKYILTLDDDPDADFNGIRRINALEWLINNSI